MVTPDNAGAANRTSVVFDAGGRTDAYVDGGRFASSYRIKDRQITVVNRALGRVNLTILTLDSGRNAEGRSLPRSYVVQTWDATTGDLKGVETVQNLWVRVGAFDLPAALTATTTSDAGFRIRSVTLSGHRLGAKAAAVRAPAPTRGD